MDSGQSSSAPKKMRFRPKPIQSRPVAVEIPVEAEDDSSDGGRINDKLRRRLQERGLKQRVKPETQVQVALTHGGGSSNVLRNFGVQVLNTDQGGSAASSFGKINSDDSKAVIAKSEDSKAVIAKSDGRKAVLASELVDKIDEVDVDSDSSSDVENKDYKSPWDYKGNYPTTLPLRKSSSVNPEDLDKEEFENPPEYDETTINPTVEIGLLDKGDETQMIFFQFPPTLPSIANPASGETGGKMKASKGKEKAYSNLRPSSATGENKKGCKLEELSGGLMGKMLVYKSGAVKLKLGNVLYDVSPGVEICAMQNVMAIDTSSKTCTDLGSVDKRAVVSVNVDSLLESV